MLALAAQLCPTLCDHMDYSLPGSSVHGNLQARILELVFTPFSRGSSWPRDQPQVSCITDRFFTVWATREALKNRFRCFRPLWTIKKAEHQRFDAFELWCWRRLLRVPWTARRSNQSILKEINPELERLRLKLKLQYFGQLTQRPNSLEKILMLEKTKGKRRGDRGWHG